uniref:Uncharacterized protein n=1 Tax=Oryza brachyantha TaxID=4533 RepID=J3N9Y6_ORYBR
MRLLWPTWDIKGSCVKITSLVASARYRVATTRRVLYASFSYPHEENATIAGGTIDHLDVVLKDNIVTIVARGRRINCKVEYRRGVTSRNLHQFSNYSMY